MCARSNKSEPKIIVPQYRPIPLRRLTNIYANPDSITKEEAWIIANNDIARREIIRLGLSPSKIVARFNFDDGYNDDELFQ